VLALHSPTDFQNPPKNEAVTPREVTDFSERERTATNIGTIEIERLGSQDPSSNLGVDQIPGQLKLNDSLNDSISADSSGEMRIVQGGASAMEGAVKTLAKLVADALEAENWDLAESLTTQLQRVIAIRTSARRKREGQ